MLRLLLKTAAEQGFTVGAVNARTLNSTTAEPAGDPGRPAMAEVSLTVQGRQYGQPILTVDGRRNGADAASSPPSAGNAF